MKVIAMDYDDTFSLDPEGWAVAMGVMKARGFTVWGVTARNRGQIITCEHFRRTCTHILYCAGAAKRPLMERVFGKVSVWIDDKPEYVTASYKEVHGEVWVFPVDMIEVSLIPLLHEVHTGRFRDA